MTSKTSLEPIANHELQISERSKFQAATVDSSEPAREFQRSRPRLLITDHSSLGPLGVDAEGLSGANPGGAVDLTWAQQSVGILLVGGGSEDGVDHYLLS